MATKEINTKKKTLTKLHYPHAQQSIVCRKKNQMRVVNFATHTLEWQHFSAHRQWSWRQAQTIPHRIKPDREKTKTLDKE